jgi:hypothetical protein
LIEAYLGGIKVEINDSDVLFAFLATADRIEQQSHKSYPHGLQ